MNDSFFQLPDNKRNKIINAGFRVFSQYTYKKSPMSEIAAEAGISKSLLFYYFKNKKELYLHLCRYSVEVTQQAMIWNCQEMCSRRIPKILDRQESGGMMSRLG